MATPDRFRVQRGEPGGRDDFQCSECGMWWSRPTGSADDVLDQLEAHECSPSPLSALTTLQVAALMLHAAAEGDDEELYQLVQDAAVTDLIPRADTMMVLARLAAETLAQSDRARKVPAGTSLAEIDRVIAIVAE
jgi:hypothetical protein